MRGVGEDRRMPVSGEGELNYILTVYVITVYYWQNLTVLKLDQQGAML